MKKLFSTLVIFSFFLLKSNYGKLGDRYAVFLFFHFLNTVEKMKKMMQINGIKICDFQEVVVKQHPEMSLVCKTRCR